MLDGTQPFDEITLKDALNNQTSITYASKVALDNEVARLENDKADITYVDSQDTILDGRLNTAEAELIRLEDDKADTTYVDSQDTALDNQITLLENANMIKSIIRTGNNLLTITYYDNTTSTVITLSELKIIYRRSDNFIKWFNEYHR